MPTKIKLIIGTLELSAELNESPSARKLISLLPLEFNMSRWGDEYYGDCGIKVELSSDARDIMEVGELAVWPTGNALCIFFGPTPVSEGNEPKAVSPVNPVGRLLDDYEELKKLGKSIKVRIEILK
ncbi:MAG: cyclophilin-like fold protein [Thermodesulfovibrionales bacterium]